MNDLQDIAKLAATPKAEGLPGHTKIKATIKEYEARKQRLEEKDHDTEDAQAERSRKETVFRSKLDPGKPPSSDAIGSGGETEHVDNISNAARSLAAVENAPVNNSAPPCTMPEVASTPLRPTNTSTVPVPPTMAAATTTTKKVIDPLEAVRQRIVSLETGTPLSKSISKRDPLAIDRKKRTKSRQKPYICPGKGFCKSLLCAHESDNAKEEQEKLGQLVTVVKKKFKDLENKSLSTAYVNAMLIQNHDALVPTINTIKADLLKRTTALTSTGRLTLTDDPVIRKYSHSELLGRNIYVHLDFPITADYDAYLSGVEKHQTRLLDLVTNGNDSYYAKDIKKCNKSPSARKSLILLYEIEARLMEERSTAFAQAQERGEKGDVLQETLRRFDESIWNLEWMKEKIESVVAIMDPTSAKPQGEAPSGVEGGPFADTGVIDGEISSNGASDGEESDYAAARDAEVTMNHEQVLELIQNETQARDNYAFSCMMADMEMESHISNTGPFDMSTPDEAIKKLMKDDKNRNDPKTKKVARATLRYKRQQEQKRLEGARLRKICVLTQNNITEQYNFFKKMEARELTAANAEDEAVKKSVAAGWDEFGQRDLLMADEKTQTG